jgi:hypothetical protein
MVIVGGNGFSALSRLQCLKFLVIGGGKILAADRVGAEEGIVSLHENLL